MHVDIPTLETERLRLRPFRDDDLDDYAELCADPEVTRWLPIGRPVRREAAWRVMALYVGHWLLRGSGQWVVEEKETSAFVGRAGFCEPPGWPGFELAGAQLRRFWGRGYALEVGRALLRYAFTVLGKDRVISCILPENLAAIRVVERLGETLQGPTQIEGKELLVYGIDREAWERAVVRRSRSERAPGALRAGPRGL